MKVAGIIVEYNPLHNGHVHHIKESRRLSKCDYLVCVMSSNFTQRGEPAIIDKFTRTKMALQNGVDLVIELPFVFTVQNANIFARTSVEILHHLKVDEIYFGSETGNIKELEKLGTIMSSYEYNNLVKKFSKEGNSYPTSSDLAMKELYPSKAYELPNNILGIQYILAGKDLNSKITFHTIDRLSVNYFDEIKSTSNIQSASAIRKSLVKNEDISVYVPSSVHNLLNNRKLVTYEDFYAQFTYILKSKTKEDLGNIFNINEGFENRLLKAKGFTSVQTLIDSVLTRRYTNSKVKRSLAHILCNTKKELITSFEIPYIRILGMNQQGKAFLNSVKHDIEIPIISKVKEGIHPYLDMELRVSKIYEIASDTDSFKEEFKPLINVYNS
jgi:predicted nucleotidyltransferase